MIDIYGVFSRSWKNSFWILNRIIRLFITNLRRWEYFSSSSVLFGSRSEVRLAVFSKKSNFATVVRFFNMIGLYYIWSEELSEKKTNIICFPFTHKWNWVWSELSISFQINDYSLTLVKSYHMTTQVRNFTFQVRVYETRCNTRSQSCINCR